ncbi:hypothetical protein [Pseudomonas sp. NMS19W]|uniref:hypothetical protein n=1 Tax=Pseudomonas sp. NMS19W TaxID=3079768 RepID=UPI003F65F5CD
MNTKQNVPRVVIVHIGHRLSAITSKNKLVEGTIVSMDSTSIKVKNAVNLNEIILPSKILAVGLDDLDYLIHEPFDPDYLPGLDVFDPTNTPK